MKFNFMLMVVISMFFASCNVKNNTQNSNVSENPIAVGVPVSELDQKILHVFQDSKSNFWFSAEEEGVFHYNGQNLTYYAPKDGLVGSRVIGMQEDANGNLFFETLIGVSKFDGSRFKRLKIKERVVPPDEWTLKSTDLWFRIGFDKKGPYRYDGEYLHYLEFPKSPQEDIFHQERPTASYSPYGIYSIYTDRKGFIWFGTSGLGLCRFDGESIRWHYEKQLQKTPSGGDFGTRSILEDNDGFFWFNNSRYRYEILPNKEKETTQLAYKKENGIGFINEEQEMDYPYFLSSTVDQNGDLWMLTYGNGVWRNTGKELIHYPIENSDKEVLLFSIYKDSQDSLWLGTHNDGVYKFNGTSFVKFIP